MNASEQKTFTVKMQDKGGFKTVEVAALTEGSAWARALLQYSGVVVDVTEKAPEPTPEVDGESHTMQLSTGKTVTGVYWVDGENGLEEFGCNEWDSLTDTDRDELFTAVEKLADEAARVF